jgi:hypothetical protein
MRLVETVVSFDRMVGLDYLAVVRILSVGTNDFVLADMRSRS